MKMKCCTCSCCYLCFIVVIVLYVFGLFFNYLSTPSVSMSASEATENDIKCCPARRLSLHRKACLMNI